jgi:hypothetical protein
VDGIAGMGGTQTPSNSVHRLSTGRAFALVLLTP